MADANAAPGTDAEFFAGDRALTREEALMPGRVSGSMGHPPGTVLSPGGHAAYSTVGRFTLLRRPHERRCNSGGPQA